MLHDTHIHFDAYDDADAVLRRAGELHWPCVWVTTEPSSFAETVARAKPYANITVAPGLHPQGVGTHAHELPMLLDLIAEPSCRWVGEVGLDGAPPHLEHWDAQVRMFDAVLQACEDAGGRVLTVHSRRSADAVIERIGVLSRSRVVMHWFSGDDAQLDAALRSPCFFSVNPAMVKSSTRRHTVKRLPPERVVLETDGPYALIDGRPSTPDDLPVVVAYFSSVWGRSREDTEATLSANFARLADG